ncbi:MAG TPA: cytochrome c oxidase subunit II [Solirubrobacterales bacterium]|nr:cytochrome c oxidase subunit II [Solirubrobacterales bacterium]
MSPSSPGADQIDTLLTIGTVIAAILVVAINVALVYALRRYRSDRGAEPRQIRGGRGTQLRVGAVLSGFALVVLVLSFVFTGKAREVPATGSAGLVSAQSKPLEIEATGQQWLWRYDYPNSAFSYYKLVVPVDTTVELDLVSTDVIHTWDVPELAAKRDAVPGKTNHVVFRADEEGTFDGQSTTFSGQAYASMRTAVEVVSPQAYEDFVKSQKADIQAAQDRVVGLIEEGEVP